MPETQAVASRRFGIEIEFAMASRNVMEGILSGLRDAGLTRDTRMRGYSANDSHSWIVKDDASIGMGGELVSPPLNFENPEHRAQVVKAVEVLAANGAKTSDRCGIHVHVESSDLTPKEVAAVARLFIKFEDCIYRLASSGWRTIRSSARQYAPPMNQQQVQRITRVNNEEQLKRAYYGDSYMYATGHGHNSRYCGLNLHSHFYRGTIEFRVFNSSLNPKRVSTYVSMCVAMVNDAKKGKIRSIAKAYRVGAMQSGQVTPRKALFNFLQVLRYGGDMSLEDYRNVKKFWEDSNSQSAWGYR